MKDYKITIGLEVHIQLNTKSKLFCSCSTEFGQSPNSAVCPVCMGMPGVLPVMNKKAVEYAVMMGLALNCKISLFSKMDRKNYFYPDLPKNYQISQYDMPFAEKGYLDFYVEGERKRVGITRVHLEEDAGKNIHSSDRNCSYVDYNRTGVPLLEVVSEPDISSPKEAFFYLKMLRQIARYLGISDGNMEEGSLRCDANISVAPVGSDKLGTKVELKNLNSFKFVQKALEYEAVRQVKLLKKGEKIIQETRLFDDSSGKTFSMRSKEEAHDYRYFPDPDLLPFVFSEEYVNDVKQNIPELPLARKERFMKEYGIPEYDADVLTSEKSIADYYEETVKICKNYKLASNWMMGEWMKEYNKLQVVDLREIKVKPDMFAELLDFLDKGKINTPTAKEVLTVMFETGEKAGSIIKTRGLEQIGDKSELENIIKEIVEKNPKTVEDYRSGKKQAIGFFVGQVMKATKGKANPKVVNEILRKMLGE